MYQGILAGEEESAITAVSTHLAQSMLQRLLRYGHVTLETVSTQGRITLEAIPDPARFPSEVDVTWAPRVPRARAPSWTPGSATSLSPLRAR